MITKSFRLRAVLFNLSLLFCSGCLAASGNIGSGEVTQSLNPSEISRIEAIVDQSPRSLSAIANQILAHHYKFNDDAPRADYRLLLAGIDYAKMGELEKAESILREYKNEFGAAPEFFLSVQIMEKQLEAEILLKKGQHHAAINIYNQLQERFENNNQMWWPRIRFCEILLQLNDPNNCLARLHDWNFQSAPEKYKVGLFEKYFESKIMIIFLEGCSSSSKNNDVRSDGGFPAIEERLSNDYLEELVSLQNFLCRNE